MLADESSAESSLETLADLVFVNWEAEHLDTLALALEEVNIYFKRTAGGYLPRGRTAVKGLKRKHQSETRRRKQENEFISSLKVAVDGQQELDLQSDAHRVLMNSVEQVALSTADVKVSRKVNDPFYQALTIRRRIENHNISTLGIIPTSYMPSGVRNL